MSDTEEKSVFRELYKKIKQRELEDLALRATTKEVDFNLLTPFTELYSKNPLHVRSGSAFIEALVITQIAPFENLFVDSNRKLESPKSVEKNKQLNSEIGIVFEAPNGFEMVGLVKKRNFLNSEYFEANLKVGNRFNVVGTIERVERGLVRGIYMVFRINAVFEIDRG